MPGVIAVKHIPMAAKSRPARNANGMRSRDDGIATTPKIRSTGSISVAYIMPRVAPQSISPAITSSMLTGVAMIASNVFW